MIAGLSARLKKLEAIAVHRQTRVAVHRQTRVAVHRQTRVAVHRQTRVAVHRQTRVIVINSGPGGKERAEREIAALEAAGCRDRIVRVCTGVRG
jgi:hypothetical protein